MPLLDKDKSRRCIRNNTDNKLYVVLEENEDFLQVMRLNNNARQGFDKLPPKLTFGISVETQLDKSLVNSTDILVLKVSIWQGTSTLSGRLPYLKDAEGVYCIDDEELDTRQVIAHVFSLWSSITANTAIAQVQSHPPAVENYLFRLRLFHCIQNKLENCSGNS